MAREQFARYTLRSAAAIASLQRRLTLFERPQFDLYLAFRRLLTAGTDPSHIVLLPRSPVASPGPLVTLLHEGLPAGRPL